MTGNARGTLGAAALGAAVGVAAGLLLVSGLVGAPVISDTPVYQGYGERMAAGQVPYRDFRVEYPPGALPVFLLPALVTSAQDGYDEVFAGLMIASLAALAALTAVSLRLLGASGLRVGAALATLAGGLLLLGPFILTRFDLVPALVAAAAVAMALAGHERLGAAALGAAVATKLYPAVLLPLLVARSWRRHGRAAGLRTLALTVGVTVLVYLPFAAISPRGVTRSVWQQLGRPLQIESLGSATLLALHHAFAMPLGWASSHGSQNLTGTSPRPRRAATTVAGVAALVWVWVAYARGDAGGERLVRFAAAAVVAFVAFGKVLSPQFLVWLLPLVPLVAGRRGAVASGLLVLACGLTRLWFPGDYWALVKQFDERASWLVLGRDLALVALFALLVAPGRSMQPELYGHGTRTGSIAVARPVAGSHVTSAPSIRTPPSATSKRTGMPVRIRWVASSAFTPITESCGPVMPASVIAAVPPGSTRASEVWTCVCVPITAVTRPSSQRESATFSLVASACTSTTTTGVSARASSTSSSTTSHMLRIGSRNSDPSTLTTATGTPAVQGTIASPRPGAPVERFAGRTTRSDVPR